MKIKYIALIGAGTTLEIYDSYIVGFMLPMINQIFFPKSSYFNLMGLVSFSILFIVRPIGAVFWGILGDKYGKFLIFKHAILFMALATLGIGLLPTYGIIGMLAPLLLLFFRVVQGVSISGEFGSAVVLCYEQSLTQYRFINNGILYFFIFAGILIASALINFVKLTGLPENIAWRIPFLFGGLMGVILYQVRKKIKFTEIKYPHVNFKLVFTNYKLLIIVICAILLINLNWLYFSSINIILIDLKSNTISKLSIFCCWIVMIGAFISGKYVANKIKGKILVNLSLLIIIMYGSSLFFINYFSSNLTMIYFYYLEAVIAGLIFATLPVLILDHIPSSLHNSVYNIANNISTTLIVGVMPFLIVYLTQNDRNLGLSAILIINLLISLISLINIKILSLNKPKYANSG